MTSVFTIKLTHLTTGALKLIPIDDEQFRLLIANEEHEKFDKDWLFADIMYRHNEERDWFDHYEFNGIFLGTIRKDRT